jgi:hypothetical protein
MCFVARFELIDEHLFRFDTRIYLGSYNSEDVSECVGAIIGKNPGSAKPNNLGTLEALNLDGDKMLPFVKNRFCAAYKNIGKPPPSNGFVRVWNLFYLCNADLKGAKSALSPFEILPSCSTETEKPPLVWFGWGGNDQFLNPFKTRFINTGHNQPFFYNYKTKQIQQTVPSVLDTAKHTQGMPMLPVEQHLAKVL